MELKRGCICLQNTNENTDGCLAGIQVHISWEGSKEGRTGK